MPSYITSIISAYKSAIHDPVCALYKKRPTVCKTLAATTLAATSALAFYYLYNQMKPQEWGWEYKTRHVCYDNGSTSEVLKYYLDPRRWIWPDHYCRTHIEFVQTKDENVGPFTCLVHSLSTIESWKERTGGMGYSFASESELNQFKEKYGTFSPETFVDYIKSNAESPKKTHVFHAIKSYAQKMFFVTGDPQFSSGLCDYDPHTFQ